MYLYMKYTASNATIPEIVEIITTPSDPGIIHTKNNLILSKKFPFHKLILLKH